MDAVVQTVRDTIVRHRLVSPRDTVLAAVSGGPDSVCMLHALLSLREELGFDVKVAHLDHGFRGDESRADAEFVSDLTSRLGVPCILGEENVPRFVLSHSISKQDAARMIRYRFLIRVSKLEYCQRVATGHNADDQAETVLMRLLRGAGPEGLAGIPVKRDDIIRPLLWVWRQEVEAYLTRHGLPSRTDSSNLEPVYLRNRVRSELLPALAAYNPGIARSLTNLATIMGDVSAHFDAATDRALTEVVKSARVGHFALDLGKLNGYDEALRRYVFRRVFELLRPDLAPLPFHHVESLMNLVRRGEVGVSVELPDGAQARLEHGVVVIAHGSGGHPIRERGLPVPGEASFEGAGLRLTAELVDRRSLPSSPDAAGDSGAFFDWSAIRPPLLVRGRRQGDRFRPFGMEGTKSLKQLMIDSKIAASFRDAVPLVCDQHGILWVVGMRRSAAAPVTGTTDTVLVLRAQAQEDSPGPREDPAH
jgi:tRNA(Ile)-lysidine synthase